MLWGAGLEELREAPRASVVRLEPPGHLRAAPRRERHGHLASAHGLDEEQLQVGAGLELVAELPV